MSVTTWKTQLLTALAGLPSSPIRLSTLSVDVDQLTLGQTGYQPVVWQAAEQRPGANIVYPMAEANIAMFHRLLTPTDETYFDAGMLADMEQLVSRPFYTALASTFEVFEGPESTDDPTRDGDVVAYIVRVRCLVT